jgi:putative hydrolases of HD superfamily
METINKLRQLYKLKEVERTAPVGKRKESSAEHSWSSLILANYFLDIMKEKLDKIKVYELLMYHDVVEIKTGDVCISDVEGRKNKHQQEFEASKGLRKEFPELLGNKFFKLFKEFSEQKTRESKFAKAIDSLDAEIHFLDYKEFWKGWTPEMVRKLKFKDNVKEFPEVEEAYEKVLEFATKEGYFNQ